MVKTLKFIVKTILFDGLESCMCERWRYNKKHQKWDQTPSPNLSKINTKSMLEKWIPKRWKITKQVIQKGGDKWEKTRMKNMRKQKYKKREQTRVPAQSGTLPLGPGNTIRSKIEDKLTEEKLKDRESAANVNTPWAPSGPERIQVARGKVPLWAKAGEVVFEGKCSCIWGIIGSLLSFYRKGCR